MFYGTQITIVIGGFINQQTSLGGPTLYNPCPSILGQLPDLVGALEPLIFLMDFPIQFWGVS